MTQSTNTNTNKIIKDVNLFWAKLDKPVEPFGTMRWEIQLRGDKSRLAEFNTLGKAKVNDDGSVQVNLQKKAFKRDGTEAQKVRVVDNNKLPLDPAIIGNGSVGNVLVMQSPYEMRAPNGKVTKSGISTMLIAVQITKLVKYEPKSSIDFDTVDGDASSAITEDDKF